MLSTSFQSEEKLARFLNGKDKVKFIRRYTDLLDRLFYWKLKQTQWDYYLQIGQTQNTWTNRVPKLLAEKNAMVHAYGRSKSMIGQRRIQIEKKLEYVQNAIAQFEQQVLSQSMSNVDYSFELSALSSIVRTFVHGESTAITKWARIQKTNADLGCNWPSFSSGILWFES